MKHNRRTPREIMRKLTMADQLIMQGKMVANAVSISTPNWGYPDSVDRCQGFTVESVRVLMNCCS